MKEIYICKGSSKEITGVPDVVQLLPMGHVKSRQGDFYVDEESLRLMKEHMLSRGIDVVIDYEHQTLKDVQAPAGGWIKDLFLQDGTVCAKVEWTPNATKYLENKEYRYLSPVVRVRGKDKKVTELHSAALTNTPAIDNMYTIVNSTDFSMDGGNDMDLKELAALLGLDENATEQQIMEKLKATLGELQEHKVASCKNEGGVVANKTICGLLGVNENAKTEEVSAAIIALKNSGGGLAEEIKALKEKMEKRDADEAVIFALKAGKVSIAQKAWATEYALKDPSGFKKFVELAPVSVPVGEIEFDAVVANKEKSSIQDEATLTVCKALGLTKEDIEKYGKGVK